MKKGRLIIGLDIGTAKTSVTVGEVTEAGLGIIGYGSVPSRGIKKGAVINIEDATESIRDAVREAEAVTGIHIKAVHLGIGGEHIDSLSSHGVIALTKKDVSQKDVDSVIDAARAVAVPFDREILQVIPLGFSINGQNGITDPRGMGGVRLETKVRIITGSSTSVQNFTRCCERAGLDVVETVLQPLATAEAVLTEDEKSLGTAVIDIGGGTTDIAVFHEGSLCHTAVLPVGGSNFTNDIAIGLRTSAPDAERIKKQYGCSMISMVKDDEEIEIRSAGVRPAKRVPRQYLIEILQPRVAELFRLIKDEINGRGFDSIISSGVVLTGGSSLMEGMEAMAENVLDLPVRIGSAHGIDGDADYISNPANATGIGIVLCSAGDTLSDHISNNGRGTKRIISKVRNWANEIFS